MDKFERETLLKIRRDYSKDEKFSFVLKKISDLMLQAGKDAAYIQELQHELAEIKKNPYNLTKKQRVAAGYNHVAGLEAKNTKLESTITYLRNENARIIKENIALKSPL